MHQHLMPLSPLLLDQIARRAENGEQILARFVIFFESRRHDAHGQVLLQRQRRQVRAHDCEHEGDVGGAEGVDV